MSLDKRLEAIERVAGKRRGCALCESRPKYAVTWPDKPLPDLEPCEGCGWQPEQILVLYAEQPTAHDFQEVSA